MADKKNEPAPVKAPEVGSREWYDRIDDKSEDFLAYLIANPDALDKIIGRDPAAN